MTRGYGLGLSSRYEAKRNDVAVSDASSEEIEISAISEAIAEAEAAAIAEAEEMCAEALCSENNPIGEDTSSAADSKKSVLSDIDSTSGQADADVKNSVASPSQQETESTSSNSSSMINGISGRWKMFASTLEKPKISLTPKNTGTVEVVSSIFGGTTSTSKKTIKKKLPSVPPQKLAPTVPPTKSPRRPCSVPPHPPQSPQSSVGHKSVPTNTDKSDDDAANSLLFPSDANGNNEKPQLEFEKVDDVTTTETKKVPAIDKRDDSFPKEREARASQLKKESKKVEDDATATAADAQTAGIKINNSRDSASHGSFDMKERRRVASGEIGRCMLAGWTLVDGKCPTCGMPMIVRTVGEKKNEICVMCDPEAARNVEKEDEEKENGESNDVKASNSLEEESVKTEKSVKKNEKEAMLAEQARLSKFALIAEEAKLRDQTRVPGKPSVHGGKGDKEEMTTADNVDVKSSEKEVAQPEVGDAAQEKAAEKKIQNNDETERKRDPIEDIRSKEETRLAEAANTKTVASQDEMKLRIAEDANKIREARLAEESRLRELEEKAKRSKISQDIQKAEAKLAKAQKIQEEKQADSKLALERLAEQSQKAEAAKTVAEQQAQRAEALLAEDPVLKARRGRMMIPGEMGGPRRAPDSKPMPRSSSVPRRAPRMPGDMDGAPAIGGRDLRARPMSRERPRPQPTPGISLPPSNDAVKKSDSGNLAVPKLAVPKLTVPSLATNEVAQKKDPLESDNAKAEKIIEHTKSSDSDDVTLPEHAQKKETESTTADIKVQRKAPRRPPSPGLGGPRGRIQRVPSLNGFMPKKTVADHKNDDDLSVTSARTLSPPRSRDAQKPPATPNTVGASTKPRTRPSPVCPPSPGRGSARPQSCPPSPSGSLTQPPPKAKPSPGGPARGPPSVNCPPSPGGASWARGVASPCPPSPGMIPRKVRPVPPSPTPTVESKAPASLDVPKIPSDRTPLSPKANLPPSTRPTVENSKPPSSAASEKKASQRMRICPPSPGAPTTRGRSTQRRFSDANENGQGKLSSGSSDSNSNPEMMMRSRRGVSVAAPGASSRGRGIRCPSPEATARPARARRLRSPSPEAGMMSRRGRMRTPESTSMSGSRSVCMPPTGPPQPGIEASGSSETMDSKKENQPVAPSPVPKAHAPISRRCRSASPAARIRPMPGDTSLRIPRE